MSMKINVLSVGLSLCPKSSVTNKIYSEYIVSQNAIYPPIHFLSYLCI